MQATGDKYNSIIEPQFGTSETLFDNTISFDSSNGMLDCNTKGGYCPIFLLIPNR